MKQQLVELYQDELNVLRKQGEAFASAYPKIASRLKLGQGNVEDPLVGRLMESFAFLTAQVRHEVAEEQQLLTENTLQLLYPHYFLPLPSYSTVELLPSSQLESSYTMEAHTAIVSPINERQNVTFTTGFAVDVLPIKVDAVQYERVSASEANRKTVKPSRAKLSLCLSTVNQQGFSGLTLETLRFFINAEAELAGHWLSTFFTQLQYIDIDVQDEVVASLSKEQLKRVGFSADETLLPYPDNSFTAYQLLTEYFAYPDKFHYLDIAGLKILKAINNTQITLVFYFDSFQTELSTSIESTLFKVNCTPMINLFEQSAEPIMFDQRLMEYQIIADSQVLPQHVEVYKVNSVEISSAHYQDSVDSAPYYGRRFSETASQYLYWLPRRRQCAALGNYGLPGDEVFLQIQDSHLDELGEQLYLTPKVLCSNRMAAGQLPYGGGEPGLKFQQEKHDLIEGIQCIRPITEMHYRKKQPQARADLAMHLMLNQSGLSDPTKATEQLKHCLGLYAFADPFSEEMIDNGIVNVAAKAVTERHPAVLRQGFCRGIDYQITVNDDALPASLQYLFGDILHQFLTSLCSINTFVRLTLNSQQQGKVYSWQAQLGKNNVL